MDAPPRKHKHGDVREDGKIFVCYMPKAKSGEYWVSPERFALTRLNQRTRYFEKRALLDDGSPRKIRKARKRSCVTIYSNPNLRVRPYYPRPSRQKRALTQKEFDNLPYGPNLDPDMNQIHLTIIPNFSAYGITPEGTVHRVTPAKRGRAAGKAYARIQPVIHPKGHQWCVQLIGDDGKRKRLPIDTLMKQVFGSETIS